MEAQSTAEHSTLEDPVDVALTFVRLAERARREGLLSLEEEAQEVPDEALREALFEVVDGTPPQIIAQILDARIAALGERLEDERQQQVSRLRLVKTGVLQIVEGVPPRAVAALLGAQLPPDARRRIEEGLPQARRLAVPGGPDTAPGLTAADLERFTVDDVVKLRRLDVRRLVRELDARHLLVALRGASPEVHQKFMEGMSRRAAAQFAEDMAIMWPVPVSQIEDAREKVAATLRRLVREHEIGVADSEHGA